MKKYSIIWKDKISEIEERLNKKTDEILKESKIEIQEYKKKQIDKLSKQLNLRLDTIIKELLPKYISLENHKRLIIEAVEKAKEEGIFL